MADEVTAAGHTMLARFEKPLAFPVFFTTVHPEKLDAQFKGRCVVVETTKLADEELVRFLRRVGRAEGHSLSSGDTGTVMAALRKRKVVGQVRDALVELETYLRIHAAAEVASGT